MNKEKITWGVILMGAGLVLLLNNMGVINFHWSSVFRLWPVILIVVGLNMLMPRTGTGSVLTLVVTVAAVVFLIYAGSTGSRYQWWGGNQSEYRASEWGGSRSTWSDDDGKSVMSSDYNPLIQSAQLSIKGGAVEYDIDDPTTDHLVWAESNQAEGNQNMHFLQVRENDDSTANVSFHMREGKWDMKSVKHEAKIKLHPFPVWSINLNMGAGSADFDLRKYKVSALEVNCGAAAVKVKLGPPVGHSQVSVESGAASIKLEVPRFAACRIVVNSALSSRNFRGFDKQADGSFATPGYAEADSKYTIRLSGGMSSFSVEREND